MPGDFPVKICIHCASELVFRSVPEHVFSCLDNMVRAEAVFPLLEFYMDRENASAFQDTLQGHSHSCPTSTRYPAPLEGYRGGSTLPCGTLGIHFASKLFYFFLLPQPHCPHLLSPSYSKYKSPAPATVCTCHYGDPKVRILHEFERPSKKVQVVLVEEMIQGFHGRELKENNITGSKKKTVE